jgi:hypothetical protein
MDKTTHKELSNVAEKVWMARNGIFHGKDKKESLAIKKANLVPEIERAVAIHPTFIACRGQNSFDWQLEDCNAANLVPEPTCLARICKVRNVRSRVCRKANYNDDEPGHLPMEDGRVIHPIDRGPAL